MVQTMAMLRRRERRSYKRGGGAADCRCSECAVVDGGMGADIGSVLGGDGLHGMGT